MTALILFLLSTSTQPSEAADRDLFQTTNGEIAVANLDAQIAERGDGEGLDDLLLMRARFFGDYDALQRAFVHAESRTETPPGLIRRAQTRAAVHRFKDALADLEEGTCSGGDVDTIALAAASIFTATGKAQAVIADLEGMVQRKPTYASRSALAAAYAAVGRYAEADRLYERALSTLETTSPFPFAWTYFARGMMWSEQAREPTQGEAMYRRALQHLPGFVAANIHLAELEVARGDLLAATTRLERVLTSSREPEAMALLGTLHLRGGDAVGGREEISRAASRFEELLAHHPLAFADHAAEFYLGPGADSERAWSLAQQNLANRRTDRAISLAARAEAARFPAKRTRIRPRSVR